MDNLQQLETIKKALEFEVYISNKKQILSRLLSEEFRSAPNKQTRYVIQKTYPPIESTTKFSWKIALIPAAFLLIIFFPAAIAWIWIYNFYYKNKRDSEIEQIKNSFEYRNQCEAIDREYEKKQAEYDVIYQKLCEEYEKVILPLYKKDLAEWTAIQNKKIDEVKSKLNNAQDQLKEFYEATKIVPIQYRKIEALQYIYDIMSTSDYDVKYAIDIYDRNKQREVDEAKLYEQQVANQYAEDQNSLIDEQNELIQEQNEIAEKARRDANFAAWTSAVQRHNTNKILKNRYKK
ncbi:MAG: hypothetical protein Q8876_07000 [Bacillota bacterium]|nr:hypothetical protein [Bacillota bacterium]